MPKYLIVKRKSVLFRLKNICKFRVEQGVNALDCNTAMETKLSAADEGRIFWNRLTKELPLGDDDVVIALLARDAECAGIILNYGNYLKKFKGYKNIYVITDSDELSKKAKAKEWVVKSVVCSGIQTEQLELLYQLYKFSPRLIWGTLKSIEDADGTRLAGVNGISLEDIIVTAVLDLPFDKCKE